MRIFTLLALILITMEALSQTLATKATRISRTASFIVNEKIEKVFPLFGPIREMEWAEGWEPEVIFSSGAQVEQHMIFRTKGSPSEKYYTWVVTQFDPSEFVLEYAVSTLNRIWFINVRCAPANDTTIATVSYTYTSLNEEGEKLNSAALERMFKNDLRDWQEAINYYIANNQMLNSN
jgi:hypothetical protein